MVKNLGKVLLGDSSISYSIDCDLLGLAIWQLGSCEVSQMASLSPLAEAAGVWAQLTHFHPLCSLSGLRHAASPA